MRSSFLGALGMLVAWILLAVVVAIPSGWVHLPFAVAAILIARGIALAPPARRHAPPPS